MSNEEQKSITPGIYLWLIAVNIYISMFAFGGGYVVVPLVRRSFVEKKKIFTEDELMEMSAVAQSSPGAIAVNLAALSGYKAAGTAGAVISCAASVIPPLVILGIISGFYDLFIANKIVAAVLKGMQSGVAALIVSVVADMCTVILKEKSFFLFSLIPIAFIANFIFDVKFKAKIGIFFIFYRISVTLLFRKGTTISCTPSFYIVLILINFNYKF